MHDQTLGLTRYALGLRSRLLSLGLNLGLNLGLSLGVSAMLSASASAAASFAPRLDVVEEGVAHELTFTGEDKRQFLLFSVYSIAHYAELPAAGDASPTTKIVSDGPAKAISIRFSRKLSRDLVRHELRKTLQRNAESQWLVDAKDTIEGFIEAIDRGTVAGDRLTYFWLPGGRLIAEFNDERFYTVEDLAFAKLIWSIWFGANPVCDTAKLLAELPTPVGS